MVATAAAARSDAWSAEWFGTNDPAACAPWLFDATGAPIEVPAEAIGFRARCVGPGSRGMGELVLDELTGVPLFVPRALGPEEFCELVRFRAGRYRLAAIDDRYQFIREAPIACFVVTPAMVAAHAGSRAAHGVPAPNPSPVLTTQADALVLELVSALRAALADSRTALTDSLNVIRAQTTDGARNVSELVRASATVVTAADGAGISRREPLPVAVPPPMTVTMAEPVDDGAAPPHTVNDVVATTLGNFAPVMQHFMNTKIFKMSEETSLAMLQAMQARAAPAEPAPAPAAPSPPINYAALWPHLAAVEQQLAAEDAIVVRRYLASAGAEQLAVLAREVMARSAADAAAWIRALLADIAQAPAA